MKKWSNLVTTRYVKFFLNRSFLGNMCSDDGRWNRMTWEMAVRPSVELIGLWNLGSLEHVDIEINQPPSGLTSMVMNPKAHSCISKITTCVAAQTTIKTNNDCTDPMSNPLSSQ